MKLVDVCLSPDLVHLYPVEDRIVVIVDILRATSCMTTALAHGAKGIVPFAHLEACKVMKEQGLIIAAERNGEKVDDFDKGNSPFEYMEDDIKGKFIALTTTNGTQAINKSKTAKKIIIGSFLNISAVAEFLKKDTNNILIVCAGWKGKVNLEDTLFAGALIDKLGDSIEMECDAPLMAHQLYLQAKNNLWETVKQSSHAKRLSNMNIQKDIEFCLTFDEYPVVPVLKQGTFTL